MREAELLASVSIRLGRVTFSINRAQNQFQRFLRDNW